jgi:hypothetical protein
MNVTDINGKPPLYKYQSAVGGGAAYDNAGYNMPSEYMSVQDPSIQGYQRRPTQEDKPIAGVQARARTGERNISEIFS